MERQALPPHSISMKLEGVGLTKYFPATGGFTLGGWTATLWDEVMDQQIGDMMSGDFDLLFLDIFMPGMDGLETMRLVHHQRPLVPIIVISGNPGGTASGPDYLNMATKLGAVTSLQKPFKPAALLAAVTRCLETAAAVSRPTDRAAGNAV